MHFVCERSARCLRVFGLPACARVARDRGMSHDDSLHTRREHFVGVPSNKICHFLRSLKQIKSIHSSRDSKSLRDADAQTTTSTSKTHRPWRPTSLVAPLRCGGRRRLGDTRGERLLYDTYEGIEARPYRLIMIGTRSKKLINVDWIKLMASIKVMTVVILLMYRPLRPPNP